MHDIKYKHRLMWAFAREIAGLMIDIRGHNHRLVTQKGQNPRKDQSELGGHWLYTLFG